MGNACLKTFFSFSKHPVCIVPPQSKLRYWDSKVKILRRLLISSGDMFSKLAAAPKDDKVNAHPIGDPHTSGSK